MKENQNFWVTFNSKQLAIAIHNFRSNSSHCLQLSVGELVIILQESNGWFRGYSHRNSSKLGIFPSNYVQIKTFKSDTNCDNVSPLEDPVSLEVVSTLREWFTKWRELYLRHDFNKFESIRNAMIELIEWRKQLISTATTSEVSKTLRAQVVSKIDWGNDLLGLDFVPRSQNYEPIDPESKSPLELLDIHLSHELNSGSGDSVRSLNGKQLKNEKKVKKNHVLLQIKESNFTTIDDQIQIDFSLFNGSDYLTEKFCYKPNAKLNRVIFADLSAKDVSNTGDALQLCVQVWRFGKMFVNERSGKSAQGTGHFKRALAFNLVPVADLIRDSDVAIKLYEGDIATNYDIIVRKQTNKLTNSQNSFINISAKLLVDDLPSSLSEAPNTCIALTKSFGDIISAGHFRNDLYLSIESAEFEKGGKTIPKNIEVSTCLVTENGIQEKAISSGVNDDKLTYYRSHVIYHQNCPKLCEQIKVHVPLDLFEGAHIRFEFRHCSSKDRDRKILGFAFLPLADNLGACIADGDHELYIYKCDDIRRLDNVNDYIFIPWGPKDSLSASTSGVFSRSSKECCHVKTCLVSSKLTQNSDLLSLLKWRTAPEAVSDALQRVMRIPGEELVKFLEDVLDALFALFANNDGSTTAHSGLVFKVLIHIFTTLSEHRFKSYEPAMDVYIESQFSAALVHRGLVSCVKQCAELVSVPDKRDPILKCMRSLSWLIKFIIQSRVLYTRATGHNDDSDSFRADMFALYGALNRVLSLESKGSSDESIASIQEAILLSIPTAFPQLISVLNVINLSKLIKMTINSVFDGNHKIIRSKLLVIHETVKCDEIWSDDESRFELLDTVIRQLVLHITERESLPILRHIIIQLRRNGSIRDTEMLSIGALDVMVEHIIDLSDIQHNDSDYLSNFITCFISLLERMAESDFVQLFEIRSHRQRKELLCHIFAAFHATLVHFPDHWVVMKMTVNNTILCALQELCAIMSRDFLDHNFDAIVWRSFFSLAISFLTQQRLQLESFSVFKQQTILETYGDMRVLMGFQLVSCWDQLSISKIEFIPSLVSPFLEVTLVPEPDLRKATIPIFYDMIDVEFNANGNFKQVECSLIDKLDILVNNGAGDSEFSELLSTILNDKLVQLNPLWREEGHRLINSLTKLLSLLIDYRKVMSGDGDSVLMCTYALLRFYRDEICSANRTAIMLRYIEKLSDLHIPLGNFAESAFTLQLHTNLLSWNSSDYLKKESLYQLIIDYFDRGSCWEEGVNMCKELAPVYEKSYALEKLSLVLKRHANFLDKILTKLRPENEYFRVGFYGMDFPTFLQNRVFIFRGLELEKIGAFTQRIQSEFPSAQLMTKNVPPDESITESQSQYIQVVAVKPVPEPPHISKNESFGVGTQIPESALNYYNTNSVRKFIYDRPVQRAPFDPNNEFKSLWIERTCCQIEHQLPGVLRMFEVINTQVTQVAPVEHACETIENMNTELSKLISNFTIDGKYESISPLSMRLQGILEAAVNGGVAKYMDAFLVPTFIAANPNLSNFIIRLKSGIAHQVRILEGGLTLHGRLAPQAVRPLHQRLVERFTIMRAHIHQSNIENRPSILSQPLPPIPIDNSINKKSIPLEVPPIYGHMIDDNIYSVPQDQMATRPRSAGFENGGCNARVQRSRSIPRSHPINSHLNTIITSGVTVNTGPPLPPRTSTLERNHSNSSTNNNNNNERPALPKRVRKCSNDLEYKLIDIDIESIPSAPAVFAALKRQVDCVDQTASLLD